MQNLHNLEPTLKALADVGPDLDTVLAFATDVPVRPELHRPGIRGDYFNFFAIDRPDRSAAEATLFLGTRWGDQNAPLVPRPGSPTT